MKKYKIPILRLIHKTLLELSTNNTLDKPHITNFQRREFLRHTTLGSLGIGFSSIYSSLSCSQNTTNNSSSEVVILGAGIAGLHAGHIFSKLGIEYKIFESSKRTGGRIFYK